ncbi:MAG: hypothetical protein NTU73_15240 [Ignavibacteriae bacterium]|nr:hypothetical protein [Ignavibacteriota bacterium]
MEELKNKILEFAKIAKECPENLQAKCFELLLSNYLSQYNPKKINNGNNNGKVFADENKDKPINEKKQEDIQEKDLHVKVKQFIKKEKVTIEQINQIFYKEDGELKPLYDDLKTTKASESQIRISLLEALRNAILNGNFSFNGEDVRKDTIQRKCYDAGNFVTNFKNNKSLFDNFETYDKSNPDIFLNSDGKSRLAEIIKSLQ